MRAATALTHAGSPPLEGGARSAGVAGVAADPFDLVDRVTSYSPIARAAKRLFDVTVAATGLLVTAPFMAALGALARLDSPGPALYYQRRIGLRQRPFTLIKLRTMEVGGQVTRFGRVVRPTGLDELPQLWNVLVGHMSLIGPRPEMTFRVERHVRHHIGYRQRHLVRPGISGWAQVCGLRGNVPIAERLRFDLEYVREWSLALDARILRSTLTTVWVDTLRAWRG